MKITVITLSYNCIDELKKTVSSVLNQRNVSFEYIIVDGKSTDGTEQYLSSLHSPANIDLKYISEKDYGVYDAMNKGINMANGEYVQFMNSGDYFAADTVLDEVFPYLSTNPEVAYGDTFLRFRTGGVTSCPSVPTEADPMPFIHQSALVKIELLKKHPFDQRYKVLADHNFFYTLYKEKCTYVYIPITISSYNAQFGLSAENPYRQHIEYALIHGLNNKKTWLFIKLFYLIRYGMHMRLRRLLPDQLADKLILLKKQAFGR